jgi:hypothetical protein
MKRINIGEVVVPAQRARARPGIGRAARFLSATLLCVAALSASDLAYAAHGGGGGGGGGGGLDLLELGSLAALAGLRAVSRWRVRQEKGPARRL